MPKAKRPYQYGRDPNPNGWHECSDVLKELGKSRKKPDPMTDRLDSIEKLIKEHK